MIRTLAAALATSTCIVALATPAAAQTREYNIPAGSLKSALDAYVRQSGRQVVYRADEVRSARSPGARGALSAEAALANLLSGSGFTTRVDGNLVAIVKAGNGQIANSATSSEEDELEKNDIVVTGSRIVGAPVAAPVIEISRDEMRRAGQNNLGEAIRSIPQNFAGGQNPGVDVTAQAAGGSTQNVNGGSAINLRGLGPDATLTLLNGHRLSYGSFTQSIDISAIPLAAVERIEIVADGSSAIYGSDAVAGVANVILRRDFSGVTTSARLGAATEGGDFQQQYNIVAGRQWSTGGMIVAYDFERDTAVYPYQRDFTKYMTEPNFLLPPQKHHSAIGSLRQDISGGVRFTLDGLYSHRSTPSVGTNSFTSTSTSRANETFTVAPRIEFDILSSWKISLSGLYGRDRTLYDSKTTLLPNTPISQSTGCYCNRIWSAEINAEGAIAELPGGSARLALGGGYRNSSFYSYVEQSPIATTRGRQRSAYGYGELFLPLVSENQNIPLVRTLSISAAARYESYQTMGDVATPKLGFIWAPTGAVDLKASWGKSFKVPTLAQQFQPSFVYLYPASVLGAAGYPAGSAALYRTGGNTQLKPERATTWSATIVVHPQSVPALRMEVSYFNVQYRNRVSQPIANGAASFSNPIYAEFLTFNPNSADQGAVIAAASQSLFNNTGAPYNPASVVAIVNNIYTNVARQDVQGLDIFLSYKAPLGGGSAYLTARSSYIDSKQKNSTNAAEFDLAGTLYNPPHFSSRAGVSWERSSLTLAAYLNYLGKIRDTRTTPNPNGRSMATVDFTILYSIPSRNSPFSGIDLSLSASNITNEKPPYLRNLAVYNSNYDSTNYSAVGRFISFTIAKKW